MASLGTLVSSYNGDAHVVLANLAFFFFSCRIHLYLTNILLIRSDYPTYKAYFIVVHILIQIVQYSPEAEQQGRFLL